MNSSRAMTVDQVSERLGLTPGEIRRRIRRGDLRAMNVGGRGNGARYRVTAAQLNAYQAQLAT